MCGFFSRSRSHPRSMVFVEADAFDLIPRVRFAKEKAQVYLSVRLARDARRNHFEVHQVMAWRRLVALRAGMPDRRRMAKFRNGPLRCGIASCAIIAEQTSVAIFGSMAGRAVHFEHPRDGVAAWPRGGVVCAAYEPCGEVGARFFLRGR